MLRSSPSCRSSVSAGIFIPPNSTSLADDVTQQAVMLGSMPCRGNVALRLPLPGLVQVPGLRQQG